jgi:dihydroxy-acid dehydratase
MSEAVRAGTMKQEDFFEAESCMHRSHGHCMTMGTASTMASMVEALGVGLPHNAAIPAVDGRRNVLARMAGRRIVDMVHEDLVLSKILTRDAFENAVKINAAIGGSTNAVVHLLALAGRCGVKLELEDFDRWAHDLPCLLDLQPSGKYLMEDFYYAGGLPALMNRIREHLSLDELTVTGRPLRAQVDGAEVVDDETIRPLSRPVSAHPALAVLTGNLCPAGAVIKPSAADPRLMQHRGRALVFDSPPQMQAAMADPALDCDENTVLVLRNAGPVGAPGMPEWGGLPIPRRLLERGVRDLVRISDARMSGTHYGSCVLHVSPESAVGGPLALVRTGDEIELDVAGRRLTLCVDDAELARRRAAWVPPAQPFTRGWTRLYQQHVTQAHEGCDLDFLEHGGPTPEPVIY